MCVTTILRRRIGEPVPESTSHEMCLFGKHCTTVGHTHIIYQDGDCEVCDECDFDEKISIALWSLDISSPTEEALLLWDHRTHSPSAIKAYNDTANLELVRILSEDIEFSECKSLLHYILCLPYYIDRRPLVKKFGESVRTRCGYKHRLELRNIAEEHGFDQEMTAAFQCRIEKKETATRHQPRR
ncbi:hypothetical protein GGR58DRAFT_515382 [Xylaria digitata]|nr:hypothetical protein GGR58DRAFT_515382 [Xylaria digitata]